MKKVELLSPAKDKETAIAAINSGCDAIYIGASDFGARKAVGNSLDDIKEIVEYAHKFYVKVHVTINTILTDEELFQAKELIQKLYEIGVDAIIVQDMGIFELAINGELPPIALHASTQCNTRTLEKAKFFDNLGVSRVILAREMSLEKIKEICENVNCEVETFVHGALCVSYSGQCYLSASIGGRSANRGECAQPCRKKYTLIDEEGNILAKDKHLLSLKDFNASKYLEKLIDAGVKSFKIEGRLKDKNYVKNVVNFYRKEIDKYALKTSSGKVFTNFEPNVNKTFNRGYTDYFLEKRKNCFNFETPKMTGESIGKVSKIGKNYFEINTLINLNPQDGLCFFENGKLTGFLVNKIEGKRIFPNKMLQISAGVEIFRNFDSKFSKELENIEFKRRIKVDFLFENGILSAIDEDKNEVKIQFLENETPKNPQKMLENFENQLKKTGESDFYTEKISINGDLPFLPISKINDYRRKILTRLMEERLKNYPMEVQKLLRHTDFPQKTIDYHGNVHNRIAKSFYKNCDCEVCEMSAESTKNFSNKELMRTKHCLKFAYNMCKSPKNLFLIDEKGKKYKLEFDCKNCEMIIR
ncbi:DUF3656 domain-containing protein [bacterium]|nr:DUF3656 domain-containing protein [bacterium]